MDELIGLLPLPAFCMAIALAIPNSWANRHVNWLGSFLVIATGLQCMLALLAAIMQAAGVVSGTSTIAQLEGPVPLLGNAVYVDGVAMLMLLLVSFIGLVVSRYSIRYLDGESSQGRYFRWLSVTIGAVSLMVIAGNLLLFFLAWVITSFGLHHLLLHYSERPIARRAAWTKFAISRLGDAFLLAAIILTYQSFGTLELRVLFAKIAASAGDAPVVPMHEAISWLLAFGAITKSAQVPFHTWLPDTLETPTPVSALMHAGIVNAGGYLIIRMSPLMLQAPAALLTLAVVGTATAFLGGIVMMTQTSIKRSLAWSTVAQMGFMMLQCGLGAFSVAMLHLLAHSLYKAYAFLNSGSALAAAPASAGAVPPNNRWLNEPIRLVLSGLVVLSMFALAGLWFGTTLTAKPGIWLLALIFLLALTSLGSRALAFASWRVAAGAVLGLAGLCVVYLTSWWVLDQFLSSSIPRSGIPEIQTGLGLFIAGAFVLLFTLQIAVRCRIQPAWLERWRIHAANGFYFDSLYRRLFASLARR